MGAARLARRTQLGRGSGRQAAEVRAPALRDVRSREADEEHRRRRAWRVAQHEARLLQRAVSLPKVARRARGDDVLPDGVAAPAPWDDVVEREPPSRRAAVDAAPAVAG